MGAFMVDGDIESHELENVGILKAKMLTSFSSYFNEIYEYYKKEVLTYIFKTVLNWKYHQIEDQYKERFFSEVQGVFRSFIEDYGLYNDIKDNVDNDILEFFKFEDIVSEML